MALDSNFWNKIIEAMGSFGRGEVGPPYLPINPEGPGYKGGPLSMGGVNELAGDFSFDFDKKSLKPEGFLGDDMNTIIEALNPLNPSRDFLQTRERQPLYASNPMGSGGFGNPWMGQDPYQTMLPYLLQMINQGYM